MSTLDGVPQRVLDRFWSRVDVGDPAECWLFKLSAGNHGYGQIGWDDKITGKGNRLAHRMAYELANGPIPQGMTVDHMCRQRKCCNPAHLRLLSNVDNASDNGAARRTHCPAGHPYDEANTWRNRKGHRFCRTCARERKRAA